MTLLDTERLVRKITDLLQHSGSQAIAPKLAEDFSVACHASNLRLQQCEAMIKAGDRQQAVQLAETNPNLLDMVTVLEFRDADQWRSYCRQNGLTVGEPIDARSVRFLNECYAQGITTDHPLYAAYRRAVLGRNDVEALKVLQSITRLNAADVNAVSERDRLDAKVLADRLQHLGDLVNDGDPALVVNEIEAVEAFGFRRRPGGEIWSKAQTIRCGCLIGETVKLKHSSGWLDALGKIELVRQLQKEFKLELPVPSLHQLGDLETWARAEQAKDQQERQFESLLAKLHYRIQQSEEKDTSARYVKLPEMRSDYEALHKVWRALEDFTRPIPAEATAAFRKRSGLLEGEIARRTAIRRRTILTSSAAALIVSLASGWFLLDQMKVRRLARELQEAIQQRQAHTAEKIVELVHTQEKRFLTVGVLNAAVASAETFIGRERGLLTNFESAFAQLPQELTRDGSAAQVENLAQRLTLARNALDALAPDLKTQNEPRLEGFERRWQRFLDESASTVNALLDQWLAAAEKQCGEIDYRAPLEKASTQIANLGGLLGKITEREQGFTNHVNLRNDLLQRSVSVGAKFKAYQRELNKIDDGTSALPKAQTLKEFSDAIGLIASSEFSTEPLVLAAADIKSLNATEELTLRILLGATNAGTWAFVAKGGDTRFYPEAVMPAERAIFEELDNEPAISANHERFCFWLSADGSKSEDWITVGLPERTIGWKKIKAWVLSPAATTVAFADREYGFFDGQYKLSPAEPVYRLELLGILKETASYYSVGLEKVRAGAEAYAKPLLEVLDSIKDSTDGSCVFRAYLLLRLIDLMNLQPEAWGLSFCPTVRAHATEIRRIVGGQISCGDWFLPAKVQSCAQPLNQFFASTRAISYTRQASGLLALARTAYTNGLHYAGFVDAERKPHLLNGPQSRELFGYARKQPVSLGAGIDTQRPLPPGVMPLSPLFALPTPIQELLAKAAVNDAEPSFQGLLPNLFQKPTGIQP